MNSLNGHGSNQSGQKEDYLDKGLDAAEKKYGGSIGQNTQKNRAVNEKIVRLIVLPFSFSLTRRRRRLRRHNTTDTSPSRATFANESQTDGARNMFEKATGKNVPDKISN